MEQPRRMSLKNDSGIKKLEPFNATFLVKQKYNQKHDMKGKNGMIVTRHI